MDMSPSPEPMDYSENYSEPEVVIETDDDVGACTVTFPSVTPGGKRGLGEEGGPDEPLRKKIKMRRSVKRGRGANHWILSDSQLPNRPNATAAGDRSHLQVCNMKCPGLERVAPSLVCSVCQCYFHPSCVNTSPGTSTSQFRCHRCQDVPSSPGQAVVGSTSTVTTLGTANTPLTALSLAAPTASVVTRPLAVTLSTPSCPPAVPGQAFVQRLPVTALTILPSTHVSNPSQSKLLVVTAPLVPRPPGRMVSASLPPTPARHIVVSRAPAPLPPGAMPRLTAAPWHALPRNVTPVSALPRNVTPVPALPRNVTPVSALPRNVTPVPALPRNVTPVPALSVGALPRTSNPHPATPQILLRPPLQSAPVKPTLSRGLADEAVNAQLLTLPTMLIDSLHLNQPLSVTIEGRQITVPPSCVINSKDDVKIILPPNTYPTPVDPNRKLTVTVSNVAATSALKGAGNAGSAVPTSAAGAAASSEGSSSTGHRRKRVQSKIDPSSCFVRRLYGGFDCMVRIFSFFNTLDLLRAGCVCNSWKEIARQAILWKRVSLKNLRVTDWEKACSTLKRQKTESLSMVDMVHPVDPNATWHQLMPNVKLLNGLREVNFGTIPVTALCSVCEMLPTLEVLQAEYIIEQSTSQPLSQPIRLDIGKFSCLSELKVLHLRGIPGLRPPSFSFNGDSSELRQLTQLQDLSITSVQTDDENTFSFLGHMTHLTSLSIGSCACWTEETYSKLGLLTALTSLRLEVGGKCLDGLGKALEKLTNLVNLELVLFAFQTPLASGKETLKKLKSFCVWPDTTDPSNAGIVNTVTVMMVSQLRGLQMLDWGVCCAPAPDGRMPALESLSLPFQRGKPKEGESVETGCQYVKGTDFQKKMADRLPSTKVLVYGVKP